MNETKMLGLSFNVQKLKFQDNVSIGGKITANVKFLNYKEQKIFEPVIPSSNPMFLYTGRLFTFGINRNTKSELYKQFIVYVNLHQTDPDKKLSEAAVDVTNIFRDMFCKDPTPDDIPTQVKTIIRFNDDADKHIATMDILISIIPEGLNPVAHLPLDIDINNQFINTINDCHICPNVSDLKCTDDNEHSDEGEWDMIRAELKNKHSIAIKFKRNYYSFQPTQPEEQCEVEEVRTTKSEEKLNCHMLDLLSDMHNLISKNPK
ncbi:uncharacterized protein LOC113557911, partial [Rhopalosiphum maidis]|uniref:uncharacterized protein LOC113557911 n=1 Tax=Rhopalosiphum maidis TaxID=43146 RepID=UPI000EFF4DA4